MVIFCQDRPWDHASSWPCHRWHRWSVPWVFDFAAVMAMPLSFDPWRPGSHTWRSTESHGWQIQLWKDSCFTEDHEATSKQTEIIWKYPDLFVIVPLYLFSVSPNWVRWTFFDPFVCRTVAIAVDPPYFYRTCSAAFWRTWRQGMAGQALIQRPESKWKQEATAENCMSCSSPLISEGGVHIHLSTWFGILQLSCRLDIRPMDSWNKRLPKSMQVG